MKSWRIRLSRLTFLTVLVTLVSTASFGVDLREWDYDEWDWMDHMQRLRFVEGIMVGAWAVVQDMLYMHYFDGDDEVLEIIKTYADPYQGVTSAEMVEIVNRIYADPRNREVPIYTVVRHRSMFGEGGNDGAGNQEEQRGRGDDQRPPVRESEDWEDHVWLQLPERHGVGV